MKNIWMIALVCLNILSTFGQQKIDLLGSFDRTQPIKLSEIANPSVPFNWKQRTIVCLYRKICVSITD